MRWFHLNPTVRETNRYLQETVSELVKKHGSVSNPDFEKELIATTGISYKQIKNYKNHPKPTQRLKDNSIVIKFVREKRRQNRLKIYSLNGIKIFILGLAVFSVFYFWPKDEPTQKVFLINQTVPSVMEGELRVEAGTELKIKLEVPKLKWTFRLGDKSLSRYDQSQFECKEIPSVNQKRCRYLGDSSSTLSLSYLIENDLIQQISISSYESDIVDRLEKQMVKIAKGLKEVRKPGSNLQIFRSETEVLSWEKSVWPSKTPSPKHIAISLRLDM